MCNRMDGLEGQEGMWKAVQVMLVEEEGSAEHYSSGNVVLEWLTVLHTNR